MGEQRTQREETPGLQAERTTLSWDRTMLAVLANGVLVLLRHSDPAHVGRIVVAATAVVVAAVCVFARRRRGRTLRTRPTRPMAATFEVGFLGTAVLGLGVVVLIFIGLEILR